MSFDMKYDRDGMPILPKVPPASAQPEPMPVQTEQPKEPLENTMAALAPEPQPEQVNEPSQPLEDAAVSVPLSAASSLKDSDKEVNLARLRIQKENAEKEAQRISQERDAYYRRLNELENAQIARQQPKSESDDIQMAPDDLIEGKHLNALRNEIRDLKKQVSNYHQQSYESVAEAKLKIEYPDINAVVTQENIALLKAMEPELAASIANNNDLYTKAVSTYKLIKKLNITNEDTGLHEKQALMRNASKPRSVASVSPQRGDGPLSKANSFVEGGLSDEMKAKLHQEMVAAIRNH